MKDIKDILTKISSLNSSNQTFGNAAAGYLKDKIDNFQDLTRAIALTDDYEFSLPIPKPKTLHVTLPTYEQIDSLSHNHMEPDFQPLDIADFRNLASTKTRSEIINGNYKGFIDDATYAKYKERIDSPDEKEFWVFDEYMLSVFAAICEKCISEGITNIEWHRNNSVSFDDWYLYKATNNSKPQYYEAISNYIASSDTQYIFDETNDANYVNHNFIPSPVMYVAELFGPESSASFRHGSLHATIEIGLTSLHQYFPNYWLGNAYFGVSLCDGMYENGQKFDYAVDKNGEKIEYIDIYATYGTTVMNNFNLWSIEDAVTSTPQPPRMEDIKAFMNNKGIDNFRFLVDESYYTDVASILSAYIINDWHAFINDGIDTDNEELIQVTCYALNDENLTKLITIADVYDKLKVNLNTYQAYSQMLSVYDETKTAGENMQSMLAALQAKGITLNEDASNLLDIVRVSPGISVKTLFSNILSLIDYDTQVQGNDVIMTPSRMDEYTGSASALATFTKSTDNIKDVIKKTGAAVKKIGSNLLNVGKNVINKIKVTASDFMGLQNKPLSYAKAGDETIDNTYFSLSFNYASVNNKLNKICFIPPEMKIDGNNTAWVKIDQTYLQNTQGISNFFSDSSDIHTLSELFNAEGMNSQSNDKLTTLLDKVWRHSPEIMHISATCAEIYLQCDNHTNDIVNSHFTMQIRWRPTTPVASISKLQMPSGYTNGDLVETYLSQYCNSTPVNLQDVTSNQMKKYIESAKTAFFMSIYLPYFMFRTNNNDINGDGETNRPGINILFDLVLGAGMTDNYLTSYGLPCWMWKNPADITDTSLTNKVMMEMGSRASNMYLRNGLNYYDADHQMLNSMEDVILWTPFSACKATYGISSSEYGVWKNVDTSEDTVKICNNIVITEIILNWLASMIVDEDVFIPFEWVTAPAIGSYRVQTDNEESNELAVGLTAALLTVSSIIIGGSVLTKKLVSTLKVKKANRLVSDLQWTRSDLANTAKYCDFEIEDAKTAFANGSIDEPTLNNIINTQTEKKMKALERYNRIVKEERIASRKARRLGKWSFGTATALSSAALTSDSNKSLNDSNFNSLNKLQLSNEDITNSISRSDEQISYIKEHI